MSKELCISSTPHETRLAIVEDDQLTEIYYERENEYTLAGSIYKGRVTRVLPGMQSAFVDIGLERDAFLYVTDFLEEQGESADFEKPQRESAREPHLPRPLRESRPPRDPQRETSREVMRGTQLAGEGQVAPSGVPAESTAAGSDLNADFDQGTRRFRGRRGRRRGFRGAPREGAPAPFAGSVDPGQPRLEEDFDHELDTAFDTGLPISAAAAAPVARDSASGSSLSSNPFQAREEQRELLQEGRGQEGYGRESRTRHDRGGRNDRRRGRTESSPEVSGDLQPGHRSVTARPAGEPIVLPGESLSRYGHKPAPEAGIHIEAISEAELAAEKEIPAITSRPSTLVEDTVLPWDGVSLALPGESLSRHRAQSHPAAQLERAPAPTSAGFAVAETTSAPLAESPLAEAMDHALLQGPQHASWTAAGTDGDDRQDTHATRQLANAPLSDQAPVPEAMPSHNAVSIEILHAVQSSDGFSFEQVGAEHGALHSDAAFISQQPAPLISEVAETEAVAKPAAEPQFAEAFPLHHPQPEAATSTEPTTEWEPTNASASYRVDPTAPSEFRLSAPIEEEEQQYASPMHEQTAPEQTSDERFPLAGAQPEALTAESFFEHYQQAHAQVEHTDAPFSETRSEVQLDASSEHTLGLQTTPEIQAEAGPETAPIEVGRAEADSHHSAAAGDEYDDALDQLHAFAPGTGLLEEEVIDDEEYDFAPIHGHADEHDLEEIEEETLDSAMVGPELGDFVRDEHIQRRVMGTSDGGEDSLLSLSDTEFSDENIDDLEDDEESDSELDLSPSLGQEESKESFTGAPFTEADFAGTPLEANGHAEGGGVSAPRRDDFRRRDNSRDNGRDNRRGNRGPQRSRGNHRQSAQTTDLPIISDLLKQGQEVLIQIAKEPIAKKGARITSHIALPGRFLVFMPTVNHVGVSRKISSDEERYRLKQILTSEKGGAPGGFIVRTAADGASEEELRADLRFLISLWTEIKTRSDSGKAPALIYHDLNLVERVLRDQVSDNFSTIWVDSETEYERIVRFLNRFEPSLVRRVKLYTKETPLFEQFGIQEEISKALKSKVWLKSGGSIVINQTEALVAIDINTGKFVGKTARLEDTIVKTNLDAIPEIVRQIRLRDLGGIIIIDFIDMDERKNRNRVMQALEDELKSDRAPSKVLQFNDFGLVAITRKRVKQSLERTLSTQCEICAGTGMVKSPITVCNEIYTELRKMMKHFERGDILLRVHPEIVKTLKLNNGKWLSELEEMIGRTIIVKSDPALHPEQFDIH